MGRGFGGGSFGGGNSGGGSGGSGGGNSSNFDNNGYYGYHGDGGNRDRPFAAILAIISVFLVLLLRISINGISTPSARAPSVTTSSRQRTALPALAGDNTVLNDRLSQGDASEDALTQGLQYFYEKTGIVTHFYHIPIDEYPLIDAQKEQLSRSAQQSNGLSSFNILSMIPRWEDDLFLRSGNGFVFKSLPGEDRIESFAQQIYDENFSDESHMLLLYFYTPLKWGVYANDEDIQHVYYYCGEDAATVMDSQAGDILLDYIRLHQHKNNKLLSDTAFCGALVDTADRIMGPPASPVWVWVLLASVLAVVAVALVVVFIQRRRSRLAASSPSALEQDHTPFHLEALTNLSARTSAAKKPAPNEAPPPKAEPQPLAELPKPPEPTPAPLPKTAGAAPIPDANPLPQNDTPPGDAPPPGSDASSIAELFSDKNRYGGDFLNRF